jgi:hypothetical protein
MQLYVLYLKYAKICGKKWFYLIDNRSFSRDQTNRGRTENQSIWTWKKHAMYINPCPSHKLY